MTISGKFNVFVEDKKGQEKSLFKTFSTTISTKQQDGSYLNKSLEVVLDKEEFPAERKAKFDKNYMYELEVSEAWLGVRSYTKDENEVRILYLYINKAEVKSKKKINKSSNPADDLP